MMFSDEEIKENSLMRPGDEIISIQEVCIGDKYYKKDLEYTSGPLLSTTSRNDQIDVPRFLRDGFFPEDQQQAKFAWTEEDGDIAAMVSEPGFGTTGQTTFGKDLDAALSNEIKDVNASKIMIYSKSDGLIFARKPNVENQQVSSTSSENPGTSTSFDRSKGKGACKVDKSDPRSRFHYVKYVKRHGRTIKLWECGICGRDFQHQYTLMRHLPTHTDERNFHCVACAKSFRQLSTLSQHKAIHSAERPYACQECNKTFNRVSTLISHRKTHLDEKPYRCHICPKGFHQKGNLRNHLFTHTNERPYRCNICMKGFNQQSNLVCHKNKAHPEDNSSNNDTRTKNIPRISVRPNVDLLTQYAKTSRPLPSQHSEITSTVEQYPAVEVPTSSWSNQSWEAPKSFHEFSIALKEQPWVGNGVIVDPIKTYHMGVALATKQTPFALLQSDNGAPVLVKVVDTKLPGGKQMLVPATAEDLRFGGKIILNNEDSTSTRQIAATAEVGVVQIRVPVVATVVPRIQPGGHLQLAVEEPHHAYHTALSSDERHEIGKPCVPKSTSPITSTVSRLESLHCGDSYAQGERRSISAACALPPPAPSPPLDISLDLFEPMECMGPQIASVVIDQAPNSDDSVAHNINCMDDSDIYIGKFEESIPLSDSD